MRALRVLRGVDTILAEDTRHSRKLLDHFGIRASLVSCHEHNEKQRKQAVIQRLRDGERLALISDAGMPTISDPGAELVAAAAEAGVIVWPVPGPCAAICGLVGSGLQSGPFLFCGFLPPRQAARRAELRRLSGQRATLVFYAPPHGLMAVLGDSAEELGGGRRCCVARELTKLHEEFFRGSLSEALAEFQSRESIKGEIVLIVEGADEARAAIAEAGAQAALAAVASQAIDNSRVSSSSSSSRAVDDASGGDGSQEGGEDGGRPSSGAAAAAAAAAIAGSAAAAASAAASGDTTAVRRMVAEVLRSGASVSSASKQLSQQLGIGRSQLYKLALQVAAEEASGAAPGEEPR